MKRQSLTERFAFGYEVRPNRRPGAPTYEFFIGMPRNVENLKEMGQQLLEGQKTAYQEICQAHGENKAALDQLSWDLQSVERTLETGFSSVVSAVQFLERSMGAELAEMKWVLSQIDSRFAELIHLVKFPRETEAVELLGDGIKALSKGNIEHAQVLLTEAEHKKLTNFQIQVNLGFVYLHNEDATNALTHFRYAVDYAPEPDRDLPTSIFVRECLARAYYASEGYFQACAVMREAVDLRRRGNLRKPEAEYQLAVYTAMSGDSDSAFQMLIAICESEPSFWSVATKDEDLSAIRSRIIEHLDQFLTKHTEDARRVIVDAREGIRAVVKEAGADLLETGECESLIDRAEALLDGRNVNSVLSARKAAAMVSGFIPSLNQLRKIREEECTARAVCEEAVNAETLAHHNLLREEAAKKAEIERRKANLKSRKSLVVAGFGCLPWIFTFLFVILSSNFSITDIDCRGVCAAMFWFILIGIGAENLISDIINNNISKYASDENQPESLVFARGNLKLKSEERDSLNEKYLLVKSELCSMEKPIKSTTTFVEQAEKL